MMVYALFSAKYQVGQALAATYQVGQAPSCLTTRTVSMMARRAPADEEAAKRAWLARLDAPTWGAVAAAVAEVAAGVAGSKPTAAEEAAKQAWLARLDEPTWRKASSSLVSIAGSAAAQAALAEDCRQGVDEACKRLTTREEDAKKAWLARMETSEWGAVNQAVTAVATEMAAEPTAAVSAEDIARRAWLAKQDVLSWGPKAATAAGDVRTAGAAEEVAKQVWLARLDLVREIGPSKMLGLGSTAPLGGAGAAAPASYAVFAIHPNNAMSAEEAAKRAWQLVESAACPVSRTAPHRPPCHLTARGSATHPRALLQQRGGLPCPQQLASGRPKDEASPLSSTRRG